MSNDELLKPRYELIADYPGNQYLAIGDIIELKEQCPTKWFTATLGSNDDAFTFSEMMLDKCSANFRRLKWWEKISEQDLPKYVKFINDAGTFDFVLEIEGWIYHKNSSAVWAFKYLWENEPDIKRMSLDGWLPATKDEYDAHCQTVSRTEA